MTSLYVPTIESAQQMLLDIGGGVFGFELLAYDVGCDLELMMPTGHDPRAVGWWTFYEILEKHNELGIAFMNGWQEQKIMGFIVRRGLSPYHAEDVRQETMLQAWRSFPEFRPWIGRWMPWLFNIANWRVIDFLRAEWYTDYIPISFDEIDEALDTSPATVHPDIEQLSSTMVITERGWSIPDVCKRWIEHSKDRRRAEFAKILLQNYYGYDWVAPTGRVMEDLIGTYRKQLWIWWHEFIAEVLSNEQGEI